MARQEIERDMKKEGIGWFFIIFLMFLFPISFFLCVWAPMWLGI